MSASKVLAYESLAVEYAKALASDEHGLLLTDDEAAYIIWNETGWPCFWPDTRAASPQTSFRVQLREAFAARVVS